jgi:hypothetical protein
LSLLSEGSATGAEQGDEHRLRDGGLLDLHLLFLVVAKEIVGGGGTAWLRTTFSPVAAARCPHAAMHPL